MKITQKTENILKNAGIEEYKKEAQIIILEISGLTREEILSGKKIENEEKILEIAQKRASTLRPVQQILGIGYFMGEKYLVNENVLIPRDETEFLVNEAYEKIKSKKGNINILEIGVGSGCVSIELAKKLKDRDFEILGVDISLEALEVALENVDRFNLIRKVIFRKSDLFSKIRDIEKFDLIVSNPPYIPLKEKENLQKEVLFDPHIALFTRDDEGIEFYEKIISDAPRFLKEDGILAFELGINESKKVKELMQKDFRDIEIIKDLAGVERVISGVKNQSSFVL